MLLTNVNNKIESSGITASRSFGIETNAKAFKALSDNLYSNKIGSLVREICCNAKDSHCEAGYPNRPFTVHLPCALEPWFSVQDTGVGMSQEKIFNTFASYFSSTKDSDNNSIGGYGIGAKTPFVYTDSFTIESVFEGKVGTYIAFLGKDGSPEISLFQEVSTDQPNGVTIKIPTLKPADHSSFRDELKDQLKFFEPKPIVVNGGSFKFEDLSFRPGFESCGVRILEKKFLPSKTLAVCGGIAYPIDIYLLSINVDIKSYTNLISCFPQNTLILDFSIGDLDLALSRESLSYTVKTSNAIVLKLEALRTEAKNWIVSSLDSLFTKWEQATFITQYTKLIKMTGLNVSSYLNQSKALGELKRGYGYSYLLDLQNKSSVIDGKECVIPTHKIFSEFCGVKKELQPNYVYITASKDNFLIYNDFPVNFRIRIKDWKSTKTCSTVYYIEPINRNLTSTEINALIQKISYSMGAIPIIKASDLPYIKRTTQIKNKTPTAKYYKFIGKQEGHCTVFNTTNWKEEVDDLSTNNIGGYYIVIKNRSFVLENLEIDLQLVTYGLKLQIHNMLDRPIYAVKQETLSKIEASPIWVRLVDHSREFYTQLLKNPDCQKVFVRERRSHLNTYRRNLNTLLFGQKWPENSILSNLATLAKTLETASLPPLYDQKTTLVVEAFNLYELLNLGDGLRALLESWDYAAFFEHHYHLMDKLLQNLRSMDERTLKEITDYLIKNPK